MSESFPFCGQCFKSYGMCSIESAGFAISGRIMVWMGRKMDVKHVETMSCEIWLEEPSPS